MQHDLKGLMIDNNKGHNNKCELNYVTVACYKH